MSGVDVSSKVRVWYDPTTGEAGLQIRLINKTGGMATKGYVVEPDLTTTVDRGVIYSTVDSLDPIGIVYEAAAANAEMWVWVSGIVEIYSNGNAAVGDFARVTATGDAETTAGTLTVAAMPSPPFVTDKHFQEIGHIMKARTGAGLTLAVIHFN